MKKFVSTLAAAALVASSFIGFTSPAEARDHHRHHNRGHEQHRHYNDRQSYVRDYCNSNPRAGDCGDWRDNGSRWDDNRYRMFYSHNHHDNDDAAVAALFGIAIGAAIVPRR